MKTTTIALGTDPVATIPMLRDLAEKVGHALRLPRDWYHRDVMQRTPHGHAVTLRSDHHDALMKLRLLWVEPG